jgi:hypothetical protein
MGKWINRFLRRCCFRVSCLRFAASASDPSDATTYRRRLGCSDLNQSDSDTHVCCLVRDSSEYLQRCSRYHRLRHHSHCVGNDENREDSGYTDCHAGPFGRDGRSLVNAVTRCFVAAAHWATHCFSQTGLAAAAQVVSRRS